MKRFIKRLFTVLFPILVIIIVVNYYGDAANLFSDNYEKKIADGLLNGNNITNIYNFNERLLQKYLIKKSNLCPDVLVVGSSRVMQINSSYFKGKTFINSGVSSACLEDLCSLIQLYNEKKCFPNTIIIGLDPWMLNINNKEARWKVIFESEYKNFLQLMPNYKFKDDDSLIKKIKKNIRKYSYYKELLSLSYFKSSFIKLFSDNTDPYVTLKRENETLTKLSDGSLTYGIKEREASRDETNKKVLNYINGKDGSIVRIENFDKLDLDLKSKLEFLTYYLKSKNINVEFYLSPFHPDVYSFISKTDKYKQVIESEKYFISLGQKYNVKIIGSFDPVKLNMDESYFYDGIHCKENAIKNILMDKTL